MRRKKKHLCNQIKPGRHWQPPSCSRVLTGPKVRPTLSPSLFHSFCPTKMSKTEKRCFLISINLSLGRSNEASTDHGQFRNTIILKIIVFIIFQNHHLHHHRQNSNLREYDRHHPSARHEHHPHHPTHLQIGTSTTSTLMHVGPSHHVLGMRNKR